MCALGVGWLDCAMDAMAGGWRWMAPKWTRRSRWTVLGRGSVFRGGRVYETYGYHKKGPY